MWTPENIAALCTGIAGVLGAVTALIVQIRHNNSPAAHQAPSDAGNNP